MYAPLVPSGIEGIRPDGTDGWVCSLAYAVHQMLSLVPCTVTANGAAGHNRGEVVETPPLARTQGRTVGCILNFNFVGPFFSGVFQGLFPTLQREGPKMSRVRPSGC